MVLSQFLRKRKRESQLYPKVTAPRRINLSMLSLSTPKQPMTRKVAVDEFVVKAMKIETEALLHNQNPSTVRALAVALSQSDRSVISLYDHERDLEKEEEGEKDNDIGVQSLMKRIKNLSMRAGKEEPPMDLKRALFTLECNVDSGSKKISNWEDAKAALSTVIQFPDEVSTSDQSAPKTRDDVDEYRKRIKEATRAKDFDVSLEKSRQQWKQVAQSRITTKLATSDEPALVDDQFAQDAAAKEDQLLSEKIARAQAESERLAKGKAAREMEERAAEAAREEEAAQLAASLLRPLTEEEQEIVNTAMYGEGPPGEVLAKVGTDSVQRQSLHRLRPGQWLNDEAIHYFYVMLQKRDEELCRLDPNRKRSHFFKSFFMTKLLNEGNADASLDGQYTYNNVKRWSKKVPGKDIFKLDKIFFPINQGRMHWMCAVISMTEKKIYMYDSMGSSGMNYLESLFQYIQDEHQAKKGVPLPDIDEWELVGHQPGTPCQRNGTLHFAHVCVVGFGSLFDDTSPYLFHFLV